MSRFHDVERLRFQRGDGSVGASDLLSLLVSWGPCNGCPADFDGTGNVWATDLLALLVHWGPCP